MYPRRRLPERARRGRVARRFLTEPTSDADKNAAYDRGPRIGPNPWDKGPPDGTVAINDDILAVAAQFGHTCG